MQPIPNATATLLDTLATVPPTAAEGPVIIAHTVDTLGITVAMIGLATPMIFYIVWIVVGVEVLIYLRRQLKGP